MPRIGIHVTTVLVLFLAELYLGSTGLYVQTSGKVRTGRAVVAGNAVAKLGLFDPAPRWEDSCSLSAIQF